MSPSPLALVLLLLWGTIAGLDLVSAPQGLLSRPLVAASVAGLIVGNIAGGLIAAQAAATRTESQSTGSRSADM